MSELPNRGIGSGDVLAGFAIAGAATAISLLSKVGNPSRWCRSIASGLFNALRQAGSVIGVALASAAATVEPGIADALQAVSLMAFAALGLACWLTHRFRPHA